MGCYCHTIPKCQNGIKKIRKAVVYFQSILECNDQDELLKKFTEELVRQCRQELNRLEHNISDMEESDCRYHRKEADAR